MFARQTLVVRNCLTINPRGYNQLNSQYFGPNLVIQIFGINVPDGGKSSMRFKRMIQGLIYKQIKSKFRKSI